MLLKRQAFAAPFDNMLPPPLKTMATKTHGF
jgi:hypothetical protein